MLHGHWQQQEGGGLRDEGRHDNLLLRERPLQRRDGSNDVDDHIHGDLLYCREADVKRWSSTRQTGESSYAMSEENGRRRSSS